MDLQSICEQLTCSNLYLSIENQFFEFTLTFVDCVTAEEFVFHCKSIHTCKITRFPKDVDDFYGVGEVKVYKEKASVAIPPGWKWDGSDQIDDFWMVKIKGLVEIEIACLEFSWEEKNSPS
jgi:hypothetical protein